MCQLWLDFNLAVCKCYWGSSKDLNVSFIYKPLYVIALPFMLRSRLLYDDLGDCMCLIKYIEVILTYAARVTFCCS